MAYQQRTAKSGRVYWYDTVAKKRVSAETVFASRRKVAEKRLTNSAANKTAKEKKVADTKQKLINMQAEQEGKRQQIKNLYDDLTHRPVSREKSLVVRTEQPQQAQRPNYQRYAEQAWKNKQEQEAAQQQVKKAYQSSRVPKSKAVMSTVNFRMGGGTGPEFTGGQNFTFREGNPTNNHPVPATVIDAEFKRKASLWDKTKSVAGKAANVADKVFKPLMIASAGLNAASGNYADAASDLAWLHSAKLGAVGLGANALYRKHKRVQEGDEPHAANKEQVINAKDTIQHMINFKNTLKKGNYTPEQEQKLWTAWYKQNGGVGGKKLLDAQGLLNNNLKPDVEDAYHRNINDKKELLPTPTSPLNSELETVRNFTANNSKKQTKQSSSKQEAPMTTKVSSRSGTLYHEPANRVEGKTYYVDAERLDKSTRNNIKSSKLYADSWKKDYAHRTDLSQEQKEIMNTADVIAMRKRANR